MKKIVHYMMCMVFLIAIGYSSTQAADTSETYCSIKTRGLSRDARYNNSGSCPNGAWNTKESSSRSEFWSAILSYGTTTEKSSAELAQSGDRSVTNVKNAGIQSIINKYCGSSLSLDGKIGYQTLDAIATCPNKGGLSFKELIQKQNPSANINNVTQGSTSTQSATSNASSQEDGAAGSTSSTNEDEESTSDNNQDSSSDNDEPKTNDKDKVCKDRGCDLKKASCLGKDNKYAKYKVQYYTKEYDVGVNKENGEVCMRNEISQTSCPYIGKNPNPTTFTKRDFCCGIKLNTDVPFIGRCISNDDEAIAAGDAPGPDTAFPYLMKALTNIVMSLIMVGSMIMLVASGVMRASGNASEGKQLMTKIILSLVLLGASGIILRLINPIFFG